MAASRSWCAPWRRSSVPRRGEPYVVVTSQDVALGPGRAPPAVESEEGGGVVPGERSADSVRAGIEAIARDADIVIVHDGARPLVTVDLVEGCIRAQRRAVPRRPGSRRRTRSRRWRTAGGLRTCDRGALWLTQTPGLSCEILERAHGKLPLTGSGDRRHVDGRAPGDSVRWSRATTATSRSRHPRIW
jgi:2-C-methyl-D-erythritol 4-phosphate cytidylyltransferase